MSRLLFLLLLSTLSCIVPTPSNKKSKHLPPGNALIGKIISVKDGDSLELLDANNDLHEIRLSHVDCPEKKQAFGNKAKIFTANFCFGKSVTVFPEDIDRYGRTVGVVLADGKELNLAIIEAGMGWHFKKYSKSEKHDAAEQKARKKKKGLWSQRAPIAPWDYRKRS